MKKPALALVAASLVCGPALAQNAITQNGSVIAGHLGEFLRDRTLGDVGGLTGATSGPRVGLGASPFSITDNLGIGLQFNTATTTGTYHWLGIGHNAAGTAIYNIDGIDYPFGTVTGNVGGPTTTTVNEPAVWNSIEGTLLKDGLGTHIVHSDTQTGILPGTSPFMVHSNLASGITYGCLWSAINLAAVDCTATPGYDGVRSVVVANDGTTAVWTSGVSSYVLNRVHRTPGSDANGTSYNFIGEMVVDPPGGTDSASSWNINTLCTDSYGQVVTASSNRACFGYELAMNITSPNNGGIGIMMGGNSLAQPIPNANTPGIIGINLNRVDGYPGTGNTAKWTAGYSSSDGSTLVWGQIHATVPVGVFTGTIAGAVLTVTAMTSGIVGADATQGAYITGAGVTVPTRITTQVVPLIAGETMGGKGRYTVDTPQAVGPVAMNTYAPSQSLIFNAYDSTGAVIQAVHQLTVFKEYLINVPAAGDLAIFVGGSKVAGFATDNFVLGSMDSATPTSQNIFTQNVVAGTANTAGADLFINGSASTGSAAGGGIFLRVTPAGGAGSAQNTWATGLEIDGAKLATFGGGIVAAGLSTSAVIAGSLCAAADGTFIYKAGANCY